MTIGMPQILRDNSVRGATSRENAATYHAFNGNSASPGTTFGSDIWLSPINHNEHGGRIDLALIALSAHPQ
jgi:hypothetical protein